MYKRRFNKLLGKAWYGNKYAIENLDKNLRPAIFATALIYLKTEKAAEEISKKVVSEIIKYKSAPVREPFRWIDEMIRNDCTDYLKLQEETTPYESAADHVICDSGLNFFGQFKVIDCLNIFDEKEQIILVDRLFWQCSFIMISKMRGRPYITVMREFRKIKKRLKNFLTL